MSMSFFEDGTVQFEPQGQEMLSGTYTYRQVGQKYTEFTVTLNNGESFSGTCNSYYYDGDLEFTYREKRYHFTRNRNEDPDMYERYIQWFVVDPLRNMEKASEFTPGYRGMITKENGVYKGRKPIEHPAFHTVVRLWREDKITAVEAMRRLNMSPSTFYRKAKEVR